MANLIYITYEIIKNNKKKILYQNYDTLDSLSLTKLQSVEMKEEERNICSTMPTPDFTKVLGLHK